MKTQHVTMAIQRLGCDAGEAGTWDALDVEHTLERIPGVVRVFVNPATEMAYVEYDTAITHQANFAEQVLAELEASGLTAGEWNFCPYERPQSSGIEVLLHGSASRSSAEGSANIGNTPLEATTLTLAPHRTTAMENLRYVTRKTILVTACLLALGIFVSALLLYAGAGRSNEYSLEMNGAGFRPAALVIPAGAPVAITVRNTESASSGGHMGGLVHQFAIDELGLDVKLAPGQSETLTLPPMQPGTYHYYCNQCCGGRQNMDMLGALIVH